MSSARMVPASRYQFCSRLTWSPYQLSFCSIMLVWSSSCLPARRSPRLIQHVVLPVQMQTVKPYILSRLNRVDGNRCPPSSGNAVETNDNELWDTWRNSCFGNSAMGSVYTLVYTPSRALFLSEKTRRNDNGIGVTLQLSQILAFNKLSSSKLECIYCCDCSENFCRKRKYCYMV
jgi:hypothetical protein